MSAIYNVRHMRLTDIPAVVWVDQQSFSTPWSANAYAREVSESDYSHMVVVERLTRTQAASRLHAVWNWVRGVGQVEQAMLAYGGMWVFGEEAHISTIATHPAHRRQGWGELALLAMLRRALMLKAEYVVLEVRVSNTSAQALYEKYSFQQQSVKKGYYYDNNEDAYKMFLSLRPPHIRQQIETRYMAYCAQYPLTDTYTVN